MMWANNKKQIHSLNTHPAELNFWVLVLLKLLTRHNVHDEGGSGAGVGGAGVGGARAGAAVGVGSQ
jgi:hypothetical protein